MNFPFPVSADLLLLVSLAFSQQPDSESKSASAKFPSEVKSVNGDVIDVAQLAKKNKLVIVTLKATWCEVCQEQLYRIKKKLSESKACGLTYLVLAPGPKEELKAIQKAIGFPFPFIEDKDLRIAESLGLRMSKEEIFPSIFVLNGDLTIGWMQEGRGEGAYGDPALFEALKCAEWI